MSDQLTNEQLNATVRAEAIPERMDLSAGQQLHFPTPVLEEVRRYAATIDRSVGWCLWMAWCLAVLEEPKGASPLVDTEVPEGDKECENVVMPLGTWRHLTREAERLDRSKSWLLARAWVSARPRMNDAVRRAS
jgi:hypothetical protein